jgi:hypothetical protein
MFPPPKFADWSKTEAYPTLRVSKNLETRIIRICENRFTRIRVICGREQNRRGEREFWRTALYLAPLKPERDSTTNRASTIPDEG